MCRPAADLHPHLSATLRQPHFPALQKASNEAKGLPLRGSLVITHHTVVSVYLIAQGPSPALGWNFSTQ